MKLTKIHKDFELFCQKLVGLNITSIEYSEINYNPNNPTPNYLTNYANVHSIDYSIFLHTQQNSLIEIFWSEEFFQYGIGVKINEISNFSETLLWEVSELDIWKNIIGKKIYAVEIVWEEVIIKDENNRIIETCVYPQDIIIFFSNYQKIFISVAEFIGRNSDQVFGMMDNLIVTDNEETAKMLKIINYDIYKDKYWQSLEKFNPK